MEETPPEAPGASASASLGPPISARPTSAGFCRSATAALSSHHHARRLAHKGHQNVLFRGLAKAGDACMTLVLIFSGLATPHRIVNLCCQIVSAITLLIQWRLGKPSMFLLRAFSNFVAAVVASHGVKCGPRWPGDVCSYPPFHDLRQMSKALAVANIIKIFANMTSLLLHWRFPYRMFAGHGCEQLFWRGCIQAFGIPISFLQGALLWWLLTGTASEPHPVETAVSFVSALILTPIGTWSLFSQWWLTAKGATGHPVSDAYENDLNPDTENPREKVRVKIVSAKDLPNADWGSKSDPFCICEVVGRPDSKFQTAVIMDDLNPLWNEEKVLSEYRRGDTIKFTVFDYDEPPCCLKGIKFFQDHNDMLGWAELQSNKFHPNAFEGDLQFTVKRGRHTNPSLQIAVEVLDVIQEEADGLAGVVANAGALADRLHLGDIGNLVGRRNTA